jgi:hypothetical protein
MKGRNLAEETIVAPEVKREGLGVVFPHILFTRFVSNNHKIFGKKAVAGTFDNFGYGFLGAFRD